MPEEGGSEAFTSLSLNLLICILLTTLYSLSGTLLADGTAVAMEGLGSGGGGREEEEQLFLQHPLLFLVTLVNSVTTFFGTNKPTPYFGACFDPGKAGGSPLVN